VGSDAALGVFLDRGGFNIWPEGADTGSESDEVEQALLEVMQKQFGNRAVRTIRNLILIAAIGLGIALTLKVICRF
jgi:hypothetical protein